jgi:two-component system LytT family sensor kinase
MFRSLKPTILLEIFLHLLFWAFITFMPILSGPFGPRGFFSPWHLVLINTLLAIQFYLNAFVLIPVFINKKKQLLLYFALMLSCFVVLNLVIIYTRPPMPFFPVFKRAGFPPKMPFMANFNLLQLAAITAAAFVYRYLADRFRKINNEHDITNAALVSELAFLRSQISPHFIFNAINSAVALARLNPAAVEPTLIQISQLLRHVLYLSDQEKITMRQKADYLSSYIHLQKLRFGEQIKVTFNIHIAAPEKTLEPMLLISFVENAFKHSCGNTGNAEIRINLVSDEKKLDLSVYNTYDPDFPRQDEHHGIGLHNVKRRLALLYPNIHQLCISQFENTYQVILQIQFK